MGSVQVCIFEFLVEQGFTGPDCLQQFNQRVCIVRQFLEEEVSVSWLLYETDGRPEL